MLLEIIGGDIGNDVMIVTPLQPEKALAPMLVTKSGMVTLVRPEQSRKA